MSSSRKRSRSPDDDAEVPRHGNRKFTEREEELIIQAGQKADEKSCYVDWLGLIDENPDIFSNRTPRELKDKWKSLRKRMGRKPAKPRNKWTEEEDQVLINSIKKHGKRWSLIFKENETFFTSHNRQASNLKDRWRFMSSLSKYANIVPGSEVEDLKVSPTKDIKRAKSRETAGDGISGPASSASSVQRNRSKKTSSAVLVSVEETKGQPDEIWYPDEFCFTDFDSTPVKMETIPQKRVVEPLASPITSRPPHSSVTTTFSSSSTSAPIPLTPGALPLLPLPFPLPPFSAARSPSPGLPQTPFAAPGVYTPPPTLPQNSSFVQFSSPSVAAPTIVPRPPITTNFTTPSPQPPHVKFSSAPATSPATAIHVFSSTSDSKLPQPPPVATTITTSFSSTPTLTPQPQLATQAAAPTGVRRLVMRRRTNASTLGDSGVNLS